MIQLTGYAATDFASLQPFMSQAGSDVSINFDAGNQIMLSNVTLGQLNAGDFLFV